MIEQDTVGLNEREHRVLEDAFNEGVDPHRTRGVILSSGVVVIALALFVAFGASVVFLAGLTVVTLVVSAVEKFAYHRTMVAYESLLRRFVNRVEQLEGVPLTPVVPPGAPAKLRISKQRAEQGRTATPGERRSPGSPTTSTGRNTI